MLRILLPVLCALSSPIFGQKVTLHEITLKGKFVTTEAEKGWAEFKAGGKTHRIQLSRTKLQVHRAVPLKDLPTGTEMKVFAKYVPYSDGDEFERMICLVAGNHLTPPYRRKTRNLPTWYEGHLRFNSNNTIAFVGSAILPTGVDRPVCVIESARFEDFFRVKKSGKKVAKPAYIRGKFMQIVVDGKKHKEFVAEVITLPTNGIPKKEYRYILDPAKMHADHGQ